MEALLNKAKNLTTIDEAKSFLKEHFTFESNIVNLALDLCIKAHENQFRKSGMPYSVHPIAVAGIASSIFEDETVVASALLHDVVEDTHYKHSDIKKRFGKDVSFVVDGLTKISAMRAEASSGENQHLKSTALTFEKMIRSSIKDSRIIIVKLCDRIHNLLTLDALRVDKQIRIATESMEVYAPLAHTLGLNVLKGHIEDLSFSYINPDGYHYVKSYLLREGAKMERRLNSVIDNIRTQMLEFGFKDEDFTIESRVKHLYSIYRKMQTKGIDIDDILDIIGVRILLKAKIDCYTILGIVHTNYTPMIGRFKDYISLPKPNGYQTIHTTIYDKNGSVCEIQIRTYGMNEIADKGIASHSSYKNPRKENLYEIVELFGDEMSAEDSYSLAKGELFIEDITIQSPKGDTFSLPKGSIALDFAYAIHGDIGNHASKALVNKKEVDLSYVLRENDVVRIITDENALLKYHMRGLLKTSNAQHHLKKAYQNKHREIGKLSAINIFATLFDLHELEVREFFKNSKFKDNFHKSLINIAVYDDIVHEISSHFAFSGDDFKKPVEIKKDDFILKTNKEVDSVEFDYCCHPKNGDRIVAFYNGGNVVVHHRLCKDALKYISDGEEMIYCNWEKTLYQYQITVALKNTKGALAELLSKLAFMGINIADIPCGEINSQKAEYFRFNIESEELDSKVLFEKLSKKVKLIDIVSLTDAYNK